MDRTLSEAKLLPSHSQNGQPDEGRGTPVMRSSRYHMTSASPLQLAAHGGPICHNNYARDTISA